MTTNVAIHCRMRWIIFKSTSVFPLSIRGAWVCKWGTSSSLVKARDEMTQFPLNCGYYVSKFGFVCLIDSFCLAVIPKDKRAVANQLLWYTFGFPRGAEVGMRSGFSAWLLSCSSTRRGSRLTCPTASRSTTTRAPPSVSTVALSSGAWHGRGWSVTVSPWWRWHQLSMGGVVVFGGWQSENPNLIYHPSLQSQYKMAPRRVEEWSTGLSFNEDHSSRMRTTVYVQRDIWSRRIISCFPKRQRTPQWHCWSSQITPSISLQALFPLSDPRHFTVFPILHQWEDPVLWLRFLSELMDCRVFVACTCKGWWMWKCNLWPEENTKIVSIEKKIWPECHLKRHLSG